MTNVIWISILLSQTLLKIITMNAAHFHLLDNHFPVISTLIGFLVLIVGFFLNRSEVKQVAFGIFIFTALATLPAFFSGEAAEEVLEQNPGFEEAYVEAHEEAALWGIISIELLGIIAATAFYFTLKHNPLQKTLTLATFVFALLAIATIARVNNTGGEIRHPEIRSVTTSATQTESSGHDND